MPDKYLHGWQNGAQYSSWKTKSKGTAIGYYRQTVCLSLMRKLLTSIFSEAIYGHLRRRNVERKLSRKTKDKLLIDKAILKNCLRRVTNLSMAWIDYKKRIWHGAPVMDSGMCKNGWSGPENSRLKENRLTNWKTVREKNFWTEKGWQRWIR